MELWGAAFRIQREEFVGRVTLGSDSDHLAVVEYTHQAGLLPLGG